MSDKHPPVSACFYCRHCRNIWNGGHLSDIFIYCDLLDRPVPLTAACPKYRYRQAPPNSETPNSSATERKDQ